MLRSITVRAVWVPEAKSWVATSDDIPGFVTGADTIEELRTKVGPILEELIELNTVEFDGVEIPVHIFAEIPGRIRNPRAAE